MNYKMKEQEYILPEKAEGIQDQEEASRIRWLATYSKSENLYAAARIIIQKYDKQEHAILGGTLRIQGLLFEGRRNRGAVSDNTLDKANERRNDFVKYLLTGIEKAPRELWEIALKYVQRWFDEQRYAEYWCGQAEIRATNEELENRLQRYIQSEFQADQRKNEKGSN